MRDALGQVDSVLVLGGTSDIGRAIAANLAPKERLILAGRPSPRLADAAAEAARACPGEVVERPWDAQAYATHGEFFRSVFDEGDVDVAIVAAGVLGDQQSHEANPERAVNMATVTYLGATSAALWLAQLMAHQGHGSIVVLSSVAGMRPRPSNFVYGSAKAGLDFIGRGLQERLRGSSVEVLVVRPGFVHTRMTLGMAEAPFAVGPAEVANDVSRALGRGSRIVYSPPILRPVMAAVRLLPQRVVAALDR